MYTVLSRGLQTDGSAPLSNMCLFYTSHTHTHSASLHADHLVVCFPPLGGLMHARWPGWRLWRTVHIVLDICVNVHYHAHQCMPMYNLTQDIHNTQHATSHTHIYIYVYTHTALKHLFIFSLSPFFPSMSSSWISWRKKTCWRGVWEDEDSWGQWTSPMESWWLFSEHVLFRGLDWSGIWIGDMPLNLIGMTNKSSE